MNYQIDNRRMTIKRSDTIKAYAFSKSGDLMASVYDSDFRSVGQVIARLKRNTFKVISYIEIFNMENDAVKFY